jgi:NADH dehydrogenase
VADDVLANVGPPARAYAKRIIKDFGVRIRTAVTVGTFRDRDTVTLTDGTTIEDAVVAWTAGVKPGPACRELDTRPELSGRIAVDRYLRVRGANGVFAAGDVAGTTLPGKAGPLRLSVQFSIEGGRLAAQNVVAASGGRPLMPFVPYDPGYVLPLAPGKGSGIILGQQLEGLVPCALHYGMSIARSRGLRNQVGLIRDLARTLRQVPSS